MALAELGVVEGLATKITAHGVINHRAGAETWHAYHFLYADTKAHAEAGIGEQFGEGEYTGTGTGKTVTKSSATIAETGNFWVAFEVTDSLGTVRTAAVLVGVDPPTVVTGAATVEGLNATAKGTVNPQGNYTKFWFEYGLTTAYGKSTHKIEVGEDGVAHNVAAQLHGLVAKTLHHYRLCAENYAGVVARGADATLTAGEGLDASRIVKAPYRPFAADSPFNRTIAEDRAPDLAESAAIVAKILEDGKWPSRSVIFGGVSGRVTEIEDYGHPDYYSFPSDPQYKCEFLEEYATPTSELVRIPDHAVQAHGSDGHMVIIECDAKGNPVWEWDFWQVGGENAFNGEGITPGVGGEPGTIVASTGGRLDVNGPGTDAFSTAASFALGFGVRPDELKTGEIHHALFMAVPHASGSDLPAVHESIYPSPTGTLKPAPPMPWLGMRTRLNKTDAQIEAAVDALAIANGWTGDQKWLRGLMKAWAKYGTFIGDQSGSNGPWTGGGSAQPWISAGLEDPIIELAEEEGVEPNEDGYVALNFGDLFDWSSSIVVVGQPQPGEEEGEEEVDPGEEGGTGGLEAPLPRGPSPSVPKLRIPFRCQNGRLAVVEQDSQDNVAAGVYAVLAYERGSRVEDPQFGVEDPTFEQLPIDDSEWLEQIRTYEPRADVRTSEDAKDLVDTILAEVGPDS